MDRLRAGILGGRNDARIGVPKPSFTLILNVMLGKSLLPRLGGGILPEDIYHAPKTFGSPMRFVLGANVIKKFDEWISLLGEKALLFGGTRSLKSCEDSIRGAIGSSDAEIVAYSSGERYCTDEAADRLAAKGEEADADFVIGVGGGSIMDLCKLVAHKMNVKVAEVNTVVSTNAAISALSVVYTEEEHSFKRYEFYPNHPHLVIVDTKIVAEAPARFLVSGMGDASACKFEAETSWRTTSKNFVKGLSTRASLTLARLSHDILIRNGVEAKESCEAEVITPQLESVVEANTLLSGLGFESTGLAAAHSIHNGLTALPGVEGTHGELVSFGVLTQLVMENKPKEVIEEMLEFYDLVGLPITLRDINVEADDLEKVSEGATAPEETIHNEPFEVSKELVVDSMKFADMIGQLFKEGERSLLGV